MAVLCAHIDGRVGMRPRKSMKRLFLSKNLANPGGLWPIEMKLNEQKGSYSSCKLHLWTKINAHEPTM